VEECGPCPVFASFTLAFALQLRKKSGKTTVKGKKNLSQVKKNLNQSKEKSHSRRLKPEYHNMKFSIFLFDC
jgi:hypothetical protein